MRITITIVLAFLVGCANVQSYATSEERERCATPEDQENYAAPEEREAWVPKEAPPYKWPSHDNGFVTHSEFKNTWRIIDERKKWASRKALGSPWDVKWIKKNVLAHMQEDTGEVYALHWLTTEVVLVSCGYEAGPLSAAGYVYVVERKPRWKVVAFYMRWVS